MKTTQILPLGDLSLQAPRSPYISSSPREAQKVQLERCVYVQAILLVRFLSVTHFSGYCTQKPNSSLGSSSPKSSVQSQIIAPNFKTNQPIILKSKRLENCTFLISEKYNSLQDTQHIFRQVYYYVSKFPLYICLHLEKNQELFPYIIVFLKTLILF